MLSCICLCPSFTLKASSLTSGPVLPVCVCAAWRAAGRAHCLQSSINKKKNMSEECDLTTQTLLVQHVYLSDRNIYNVVTRWSCECLCGSVGV